MKHKILAFVFNGEKFLALRNNSKDASHGGDFWFTVTGSIEKVETEEEAVKREVKEETHLELKDFFDLNWGSVYSWNNDTCSENNFLAFVKNGNIKLNEEHTEYKWLELNDFVKLIKWYGDKSVLKQVLNKAMKRELFFNKKEIIDFRK